MRVFNNQTFFDALLLVATGSVLWMTGSVAGVGRMIEIEFGEWLHVSLGSLVFVLIVVGVMVTAFGIRRVVDLQREIRRRDEAERDVRWISGHDRLTRLQNREGLAREVVRVRASGEADLPWVAFTIDIDAFSRINDALGSEAGDAVLVEVAGRLRQLFPDNVLARLGSNEFFAAQPRIRGENCERLAKRIVKLLGEPMTIGGEALEVRVNVGMVRYPEDAANIELLIRCAGTAMRAVKQAGDGMPRWFDSSMDAAIVRRAQLDKQLRAALKHREIVPFYQPQIDLDNGRVIGFEALARWRLSNGMWVPPGEFVPLAEETGLIHELFDQLFRRACTDACAWPADMLLAFNLSPTQLGDANLCRRILGILADTGLPPRRLEIEITETALARDTQQARAVLADLQKAGVRIALDDFGTGYSSLSHLARLRFDKLKIDRSFVESFQDDDRQAKIVRAMLGLGRGLGMVTIAEGIEEGGQAEVLRHLGCHEGQGYLYGRAVSADKALELVRPAALGVAC